MTSPSQMDPGLDSDVELTDEFDSETYSTDYGDLFDEEDFRAIGIDPGVGTEAKPGSEQKVMMLAARYAAGMPLWHDQDCYDHGPGGALNFDDDLEDEEEDEE